MLDFQIARHRKPQRFLDETGEYLVAQEASHNLMLGLLLALCEQQNSIQPRYMATIRSAKGGMVGAALRTDQHNLILSVIPDEAAITALVADVLAEDPELPGILGPKESAALFVAKWHALTEDLAVCEVKERIYELTAVTPGPTVNGSVRRVGLEDVSWLVPWVADFMEEAMPEVDDVFNRAKQAAEQRLARDLKQGGFMVLEENHEPCCIVGYTGPTSTGIRVAPVYTPKNLRGRGYATGLVRQVSQQLLDWGYQRVFLFTDLSNPVSNQIYLNVGYRPVLDVDQYRFQRRNS